MMYVPEPPIVPLPSNTPDTQMPEPWSLIQNFVLAETVIVFVDQTFQPSRPRYFQCRPEPCTQVLGLEWPVRSRIQMVPLEIVPHSAPLATMLTQPLPLALKLEQLLLQDLASMVAPDAGAAAARAAMRAVMKAIFRMRPVSAPAGPSPVSLL